MVNRLPRLIRYTGAVSVVCLAAAGCGSAGHRSAVGVAGHTAGLQAGASAAPAPAGGGGNLPSGPAPAQPSGAPGAQAGPVNDGSPISRKAAVEEVLSSSEFSGQHDTAVAKLMTYGTWTGALGNGVGGNPSVNSAERVWVVRVVGQGMKPLGSPAAVVFVILDGPSGSYVSTLSWQDARRAPNYDSLPDAGPAQ